MNDRKVVIEGSRAIAEAVALCDVKVIAAYPITPQTHIVEALAQMHANGEIDCEFVNTEAEFSSISLILGATAAGVRSFTATSSQGLALMHEVLFAAAGLRIPVVMVVANRALSAPINIWNDHQDSVSQRDNGWIQIYCESVQEAVDSVIQAYKIAEECLLPTMVCIDGFYLTHVYEPVSIPSKEKVERFLPKFDPKYKLDPEKPLTFGALAFPKDYARIRKQLYEAALRSKEVVGRVNREFHSIFGRKYGNGMVETYGSGETAIIAAGSVCGTIKHFIEHENKKLSLVRIRLFRPFPRREIREALEDKESVIVIDRSVSLGNAGTLFTEVRDVLYEMDKRPKVTNFILGLGGVDVTRGTLRYVIEKHGKVSSGHVEIVEGD